MALTASTSTDTVDVILSTPPLQDIAQAAIDRAQSDLNLSHGDTVMFVFSPPNAPSKNDSIMVAQVNRTNSSAQAEHALGVCQAIPTFQTPPPASEQGEYVLSLPTAAQNYFLTYENKVTPDAGTVTVISSPKHGSLTNIGTGGYTYLPQANYLGEDGATFLVQMNGKQVKVIYFFHVTKGHSEPGSDSFDALCKNGFMWKISALPSDLQSDARQLILEGEPTIQLNIAPLTNAAVGETTGEGTSSPTITISPNAAGYGWFTDSNLADTATDFLPTSNPDVWMAKPGSTAAGKMDLLSVLLHEYGHALGLEHSPDNQDFMGPTLQPGERRLPSQTELALMAKLLGNLSDTNQPGTPGTPAPLPLGGGTLALVLAGTLRRNSYGSSTMDTRKGVRFIYQGLFIKSPELGASDND